MLDIDLDTEDAKHGSCFFLILTSASWSFNFFITWPSWNLSVMISTDFEHIMSVLELMVTQNTCTLLIKYKLYMMSGWQFRIQAEYSNPKYIYTVLVYVFLKE